MEGPVIVAIITQTGLLVTAVVVMWAKARLRLWERRGDEAEKNERHLNRLKPAYSRLHEEHKVVHGKLAELGKIWDSGGLSISNQKGQFLLYDLTERPLLPNVIEQIEKEESEKRRQSDEKEDK